MSARDTAAGPPYWRLSGFYLIYFASVGALLPYWGPYLADRGYSALEIGELMALVALTRVVAPNFWGWVADHTGRPLSIVRLASLLGFLGFIGVVYAEGFLWLAVAMAGFSFFWNAALPQFEAVTLGHLRGQEQHYSRVRLWGSLGFIAMVMGLGWELDAHGTDLLPWVLLALLGLLWLESLCVPNLPPRPHAEEATPGLFAVLRQRPVWVLLTVAFLMQVSHGPYYTFFSLYLEQLDYSKTAIGSLWSLGVVAEVGVFLLMHRLLPRFGARNLMLASLVLAAFRWAMIAAFAEVAWLLAVVQCLHAATFGIHHAVCISLIGRYFSGRLQGRGQALLASFGFGAGVAVGSYFAGLIWDELGAATIYWFATLSVLAALAFAAWGLKPDRSTSRTAA